MYAAGLYVDREAVKRACLGVSCKDAKQFAESAQLENAVQT